MVSKNNRQILKQSGAKQTPHYGLRKLSIGVASVLLSTTLYMGATTAYADSNMGGATPTVEANNKQQTQQNNNDSNSHQTSQANPAARTAQQPVAGVTRESLPVDSGSNHQPTTEKKSADNAKTDGYVDVLHSSAQANKPKGPTEETAQNQNVTTESGSFQYTVHYVDADTKQALAPDTVYTHHYTRTDVDDQMGDWQYKSGDYTVTGTPTETDVDKVTFTRNQTTDNKQFDYANWGIKPVQIAGYTAKYGYLAIKDMLPKEILHGVIVDPNEKYEFTFEYTKKQLSLFVNYMDDDIAIAYRAYFGGFWRQGYMGDTVNLDAQLPAGYELAPNQPTTYTFGSTDGHLTLHLKHKIVEHSALVSLNANVVQAIMGVGYIEFIEVVPEGTELPGLDRLYNGTPVANLGEQLVTVKVDEYYHQVVGVVGPSTMTIPELSVDVPTIEALLNGKASDNLSYSGGYYGVGIKELLGRFVKPSATENGKEIQLEFSREFGSLLGSDLSVPHKVVVDSQGNPRLVFGGVVDLNDLLVDSKDSDKITLTFPVCLTYTPVYKDVKQRVIEITKPDGKGQTIKQVATLRADLDQRFYDDMDNTHRTVGKWSTGTWEAYTPDEIPGYTPTIKSVDAQTVTEATQDQTVEITYTANPESVKVNYVDDDDNGSVIKTATLNGATDQTVKTNISIPHNYVLNGTAPSDYTFKGTGNADIVIHLRHATKDVSATDPYAKFERTYSIVQKIPQITHDVNGNVTYTTKTLLDKWQFNMQRTAMQDLVTGEISYGPWEVDPADVHGPDGIHSPEFSIDKIAHTKLTSPIWGASEDLLLWWTLDNTPEKYQEEIKSFGLDPDQVVALVSVGGFDGNNGINDRQKKWFDQGIALGAGNFKSGNRGIPNLIGDSIGYRFWVAGSSHNTLGLVPMYHDYAKTFNLYWKTGISNTPYDDLKELFPASQTIELISEPVTIPVTIKYVDSTTGKVVDTKPLTTNYYQDFLIPDQTPAGYVAADAGAFTKHHSVRPTAGDALQTTFEIKVNHKLVTVTPDAPKTPNDKLPDNPTKAYPSGVGANDLNKTVTRTIKVIAPTGQVTTTKQTVHLTREAVVDEVTGEVTYGNWTTGEWETVPVPVIAGYTPSQREVPAVKVTATTKSQVITINYTALPTTSTPTKPQATVAGGDAKAPAISATVPTTPAPAAERRLPQTGNQTASTSQILGLLVAGLATGLGLWRGKKKDQQG